MKLSEVIAELQKTLETHGNIDVVCRDAYGNTEYVKSPAGYIAEVRSPVGRERHLQTCWREEDKGRGKKCLYI